MWSVWSESWYIRVHFSMIITPTMITVGNVLCVRVIGVDDDQNISESYDYDDVHDDDDAVDGSDDESDVLRKLIDSDADVSKDANNVSECQFLSRDIDIANLSVRLSVRYVLVPYENGLTS